MDSQLRELGKKAYWQIQRLRRIRPSQNMMPEGVTPSEVLALKIASHHVEEGRALRPGMLADRMRMTKPALSQLLRSLEGKGLIERQRDKQDSRAVLLKVTESGYAKLAEAEALRLEDTRRLVEYLGEEDMALLVALLEKVSTYMEENGNLAPEEERHHGSCCGKPHFHTDCDCAGDEKKTRDGVEAIGGDAQ